MPEPVLVTEPDSPPPPAQAVPVASGTGLPGPGASSAQPPTTPPKPLTVPNARKGYKLTLWVSATTDAGVSDVNGLLQLDGADPVPFCMLKGVRNPLARALQEAYVAIERVRAKPPRMAAPTAGPAAPQHGPPAAAVGAPHHRGGQASSCHAEHVQSSGRCWCCADTAIRTPHAHAAPGHVAAGLALLKTGSLCMPEVRSRDRSRNGHCRPRLHKSRSAALPHRLSALTLLMQEVAHA